MFALPQHTHPPTPPPKLLPRKTPEESGTFWLSEDPLVTGSKHPDAACIRICTWVVLTDNGAAGGAGPGFLLLHPRYPLLHSPLSALRPCHNPTQCRSKRFWRPTCTRTTFRPLPSLTGSPWLPSALPATLRATPSLWVRAYFFPLCLPVLACGVHWVAIEPSACLLILRLAMLSRGRWRL